ncbi:MAG TPA: universal stress protein, partial [Methanomicrobiales archaeon]|nr:universal stress protein [Methanomicrobiales archaeon]
MFHKILVAIDGSKTSEMALEQAIGEAKQCSAELHVVYVVETGLFSSIPMDNTWEVVYGLLEKEGQESLSTARQRAKEAGIEIVTHMRQGRAGNEIIRLAQDLGVDLIMIGSHGKSNIDRILIGSVSSHVVKYSPIS